MGRHDSKLPLQCRYPLMDMDHKTRNPIFPIEGPEAHSLAALTVLPPTQLHLFPLRP